MAAWVWIPDSILARRLWCFCICSRWVLWWWLCASFEACYEFKFPTIVVIAFYFLFSSINLLLSICGTWILTYFSSIVNSAARLALLSPFLFPPSSLQFPPPFFFKLSSTWFDFNGCSVSFLKERWKTERRPPCCKSAVVLISRNYCCYLLQELLVFSGIGGCCSLLTTRSPFLLTMSTCCYSSFGGGMTTTSSVFDKS